jgi:hypothetical protein
MGALLLHAAAWSTARLANPKCNCMNAMMRAISKPRPKTKSGPNPEQLRFAAANAAKRLSNYFSQEYLERPARICFLLN